MRPPDALARSERRLHAAGISCEDVSGEAHAEMASWGSLVAFQDDI